MFAFSKGDINKKEKKDENMKMNRKKKNKIKR